MNINAALEVQEVIEANEDHNLNAFGYYKVISFQLQDQYQIFASLYINDEHPSIPYIMQLTLPSIQSFVAQTQTFNEYFAIQVNNSNTVTKVNRVYVSCDNLSCEIELGDELFYSSLIGQQIPIIF
ncbi:MAG: hypothetical protein QNJ31_07170 [Candidatus Caenarcaniphilales bacterium]|nr:hypothetical protein [Candidatus Caenarcaniphilales bacterium]